jgi:hypothetical protein
LISTAVVEQGFRVVFEPEAVASEPATTEPGTEYERKVRIMTQGFRALWMRSKLLNPFRFGVYAFILFNHKLLRRAVGVLLLPLCLVSVALAGQNVFYRAAFAMQLMFYAMAIVGWRCKHISIGRWRVFSLPFYYCVVNVASVVALVRALRGEQVSRWEPARKAASQP